MQQVSVDYSATYNWFGLPLNKDSLTMYNCTIAVTGVPLLHKTIVYLR